MVGWDDTWNERGGLYMDPRDSSLPEGVLYIDRLCTYAAHTPMIYTLYE